MITRYLFVVLAVLPALAGCAATTPLPPSPATAATVTPAPVAPSEPPPPVVRLKAHDLIGVDADGLTGQLGEPDFRRLDPPAELWQYRTDACMLDVFLYLDEDRKGAYTVTHVAVRGHGENKVTNDACVASLDVP